jgi:hypothetical protein
MTVIIIVVVVILCIAAFLGQWEAKFGARDEVRRLRRGRRRGQ